MPKLVVKKGNSKWDDSSQIHGTLSFVRRRLLRLSWVAAVLSTASWTGAEISVSPHFKDEVRVAVVGDVGEGTGRIATGIAALHAHTPLDAIIITGDNFYPCAVASRTDPRWSIVRPLAAIGPPLF